MKIPSYDAWVMARLLADLPDRRPRWRPMSAAFRPLARAMAARAQPERKRFFASFVSGPAGRGTPGSAPSPLPTRRGRRRSRIRARRPTACRSA